VERYRAKQWKQNRKSEIRFISQILYATFNLILKSKKYHKRDKDRENCLIKYQE